MSPFSSVGGEEDQRGYRKEALPLYVPGASGWPLCETRCWIRWISGLIQQGSNYVLISHDSKKLNLHIQRQSVSQYHRAHNMEGRLVPSGLFECFRRLSGWQLYDTECWTRWTPALIQQSARTWKGTMGLWVAESPTLNLKIKPRHWPRLPSCFPHSPLIVGFVVCLFLGKHLQNSEEML